MMRLQTLTLLAIAGCKFPELPALVDATSDSGTSADAPSIDSSLLDAPVDGPPRGPLFGNNQQADLVIGQSDFSSITDRGFTASSVLAAFVLAGDGSKLWVGDGSSHKRVLGFSPIPTTSDPAASSVLGRPSLTDSSTIGSPSASNLGQVGGIAVAPNALVVSDVTRNRVLIWRPAPTVNGESADTVLGQTDFASSVTGATAERLSDPHGVWTDGTRLVVADSGNHRVLIWLTFPQTNGQLADLVLGQPAFGVGTAPGAPSAANLFFPTDVYSDGQALYVSDQGHHRVLVWNTFPTSNAVPADVVVGQPLMTTGTQGTGPARLYSPSGLLVADGALLVADVQNDRVVAFDPVPTSNGASAAYVLGQVDPMATDFNQPASQTSLEPTGLVRVGDKLFVADGYHNRVVRFSLSLN